MWEVFLTWGALWGEDGERGAQQMVREEHPWPPASLQGRADGVWGGPQGSREGRQWGVLGRTGGESRGETAWGGQAGKGRLWGWGLSDFPHAGGILTHFAVSPDIPK